MASVDRLSSIDSDVAMTSNDEPTTNPGDSTALPPDSAPPTIRLDQFLQTCGVPTGGQAKRLIQNGEVTLNGAVELRRRKKITLGDEVGFDGEVFIVAGGDDDAAGEEE